MKTLILARVSSVAKKIVLAISGLMLVTFIIIHLLGNLLIFSPNPNTINLYAHQLSRWGFGLIVIELILGVIFLFHSYYAIVITWENWQSRREGYYHLKRVGKPSQQNMFSRSMIYTGPLLLLFLIVHLKDFRFGSGITQGYLTEVNGEMIRDLRRLMIATFQQPLYVIGYVLAMIPLGFHLRHGFKSALQSLGVNYPNLKGILESLSFGLATILSLGFILIPVWIYVTGGQP